jgi:general secretion pathway protein G
MSPVASLRHTRHTTRSRAGFTLLEMLVVLVIIGLLAGLVAPRLFSRLDASKVQAADAQVKMLRTAVMTLQLDIGRVPSSEEQLTLLSSPPADAREAALWRGPYLDGKLPVDPWGHAYQYSVPGADSQPFALYSLGADGKTGGSGDAADIGFLPPR